MGKLSKNLSKKLISIVVSLVVMAGFAFTPLPIIETRVTAAATTAASNGLTDKSKDGAILHAFVWSFNTIKANMADIAAAGYSTVQTSPVNQCLVGENGGMDIVGNGKWYYHYQPTDWKIGNYQLGTRDEFKSMCDEADKYGIKVIVDVLPNHTTPTLGSVAQDLKNSAGGDLYHANGFNPITLWQDRYQCTTGQMGGLPDVNTENKGFQAYYMKFVNDVIAMGGDGFRYDTAKHIGVPSDPKDAKSLENDFWPVVTGKKSVNGISLADNGNLFIYGEVLQDTGVPEKEYSQYINLTASGYGGKLRSAIASKDFSVGKLLDWGHSVPDKIVTWVESHDTYFNAGESKNMSDWDIRMSWAVIAGRAQGTPLFFSRPAGSGNGNWYGNNKMGAKGNDMFKDPEVVAANKFRNAMVGQGEYLRNINSGQVLMIERGTKGALIINLGGDLTVNTDTKLANGSYKDQVSGSTFTVTNGKMTGTVKGGKIAAVYNTDGVTPQIKAGVYFNKPSNWGTPSIYVYDDSTSTVKTNAAWPGVAMTLNADGQYFYEVPAGFTNPKVIFSSGGNQFPSAQEPGHVYKMGTKLTCNGSTWTEQVI